MKKKELIELVAKKNARIERLQKQQNKLIELLKGAADSGSQEAREFILAQENWVKQVDNFWETLSF